MLALCKFAFKNLFTFKTVAASTAFCVATASVAYVDFTQRAKITCAVVLTFGYAATDGSVYFIFVHHKKFLLKR
jgi:hypothetical protein